MPELTIPALLPQMPTGEAVVNGELPLDPSGIPIEGGFSQIFIALLDHQLSGTTPEAGVEALPQAELNDAADTAAQSLAAFQFVADSASVTPLAAVMLTPGMQAAAFKASDAKPQTAVPLSQGATATKTDNPELAASPDNTQSKAANFADDGILLPAAAPGQPAAEPVFVEVSSAAAKDVMFDTPPTFQAALQPAMRPAHAAVETRVVASVEPHINRAEWNEAFSQKVVWVANQQHQQADIQINPPNLGPVEVRLTLNQDQASLSFVSPHAAVRDAIQSALPRLTEMLASSGLTLGNVSVGAETAQQQTFAERRDQANFVRQHMTGEIAGGPLLSGMLNLPARHDGMVDLFA